MGSSSGEPREAHIRDALRIRLTEVQKSQTREGGDRAFLECQFAAPQAECCASPGDKTYV
jgi:hypothetical protein